MRLGIKIVLMAALGGLTAIAVGSVLITSATANYKNTLELTQARTEQAISALERGVAAHVEPARTLLESLRQRVENGTLDLSYPTRLTDTMAGALAAVPQLGGIVLWKPDGSSFWVTRGDDGRISTEERETPDDADVRTFLKIVSESDDVRWGIPYYSNGETYFSVSGRLTHDGEYVGVISTGVSLIALSRYVKALTRQEDIAFVLYDDKMVLAHPALLDSRYAGAASPDKPLLAISQVGDPSLARFPTLEATDLPSWDDLDIREARGFGGRRLILSRVSDGYGKVPWRIGVHVPFSDVAEQIRRLFGSIAIGTGLLVLSVVAALLLASRIARPVRRVSAAAEKVTALDLDGIAELPGSSIREIDDQARSFNRMVQALRWFQAYVPRSLVLTLMENPRGPALDAQETGLTVMFTDIAGFTPLSERMPANEMVTLLNRHFEMVYNEIQTEHGTLDKFIGDAAMAFWGAPEPLPDHATRACRAALAIAERVQARAADGAVPRMPLKIALHTGPLIVGNIGATRRMNYTVIGDTVNVCARIEAMAGEFLGDDPVVILVSSNVVAAAGPGFKFERVGDRTVRGRRQSVELWRLVGPA